MTDKEDHDDCEFEYRAQHVHIHVPPLEIILAIGLGVLVGGLFRDIVNAAFNFLVKSISQT
jgi:uncharacterized membrane protein YvlD (DUF360 family)